MPDSTAPTKRILRKPTVLAKTGLSHSDLYRKIRDNEFPKPVALGVQAVGWHEDQVDAWIESRPLAETRRMQAAA